MPTCPDHHELWIHNHNSPCADALVVRDGKVLLTRRAREPFLGHWETPGGFQKRGEHPATAAQRELREEVGLDVRLVDVLGIYIDEYTRERFTQTTVYVATSDGEPRHDPDEVTDYAWFAVDGPPDVLAWNHRARLDDLAVYVHTGERRSLLS